MNTKHTHTPWNFHETFTSGEPQGFAVSAGRINICQLFTGDQDEEQADAAFIVLACNAHDDLVAALEQLLAASVGCTLPRWAMIHMTEARDNAATVLAKAKGE